MPQDKFLELNNELQQVLKGSIRPVSEVLFATKFKKTSRALFSYIPRAGYVNNAILDCYCNNNSYAVGTLFRSIVEHSFRHLYLYTRALKEGNDSVGEEYYGALKGSEDFEAFVKINNYTKVVYPDQTVWNTKGSHNEQIQEVGKKFVISKIFIYLIENFDSAEHQIKDGMKGYLLKRLEQYTQLSSYVHGGPYAEMSHEALIKDEALKSKHLHSITMESFDLYKSIVETTYLFAYLFDKKIFPFYQEIQKIGSKER